MKKPLYDTIGKNYIINRKADTRITTSIIELLDLPVGSLVADIGAGTGNYSNSLADKGYSPGSPWINLKYIDFIILNRKLNVDEALDL